MAELETVTLPHLPANPVHVAVFENVANADFLKRQLLEGNSDFEYAFLDASALLTKTHVLAAVFRAVNDMLNGRLKSRNVHSEIVFSLSPNNNIADSFRRFGIQDTTTALVAIKVSSGPAVTAESVQSHLSTSVEGTSIPFSDESLAKFTDFARIRKIYKLDAAASGGKKGKPNGVNGTANGTGSQLSEAKEMEACVLGIMALKGS
ncbi:CGI-121-domain-containing protein [Saccharata proteae CBS 121410]|uniref:EKC/KEOPS complex subunit CGI121 n=1 Tax=Saccharata proteae CBS 121410 TaxID=1314787 RepID=A0A9P4HYF0_9PEZI|nr:CGI-121-domain-containing protein [Saccharata proteae CBS 121410]